VKQETRAMRDERERRDGRSYSEYPWPNVAALRYTEEDSSQAEANLYEAKRQFDGPHVLRNRRTVALNSCARQAGRARRAKRREPNLPASRLSHMSRVSRATVWSAGRLFHHPINAGVLCRFRTSSPRTGCSLAQGQAWCIRESYVRSRLL